MTHWTLFTARPSVAHSVKCFLETISEGLRTKWPTFPQLPHSSVLNFLLVFFIAVTKYLTKSSWKGGLYWFPDQRNAIYPSWLFGCWRGSLVHGDDPGEENGTRQCCSCFSLFAFLSSAESQPMELRVSFPLHLCPRQNPHGWTHRYVWWLTHRCTQRYVW